MYEEDEEEAEEAVGLGNPTTRILTDDYACKRLVDEQLIFDGPNHCYGKRVSVHPTSPVDLPSIIFHVVSPPFLLSLPFVLEWHSPAVRFPITPGVKLYKSTHAVRV